MADKEYIERGKILDEFAKGYAKRTDTEEALICEVWDKSKRIPAADVVEVRHGKWIDNGERDRNGVPKPFAISCSVCGSSAGNSWMRYCPNCGAKMDGKGEGG